MNTYLSAEQKYCNTKQTMLNKSFSYLIKAILLLFIVISNLSAFGQNTYQSLATGPGIWSNPNSWTPTGVPGDGDFVEIRGGHTITVTANATCSTLTFTGTNTWNLAVNSGATLNVSGAIIMDYSTSSTNLTANISGQGTINCQSIVLGNNISGYSGRRTCTFNSSIAYINVSENIVINSYYYYYWGSRRRNGIFAHNEGTIVVNGSISAQSQSSSTSTFRLGTSSPYLILKGENSFVLSNTGTNTITLNTTGSTVEYQRNGNQYVYNTNYYNLISSVSGVKTLQGTVGVRNLTINGTSNLAAAYPITGHSLGRLEMNNTSTLTLGSASSATPFPSNFTSGNIDFSPGTTVVYQGVGEQPVSPAPSAYKNLRIQDGGSKIIGGGIRVDESLVLDNACLSTGTDADIILGKDAIISTPSEFNSSQMIVTIGTGSLVKEGTQPSHFEIVYPIGEGTAYYTPLEVTSLSATVNGTGSFSARTLNERGPFTNFNDLNRYWATSSNNLSNISASIKFTYNTNDVIGDEDKYKPMFLSGDTWTDVSNGIVNIDSDFFTVSNVTNINGLWTLCEPTTTYYSYQSGDWKDISTWTTDPSGSVWEGGGIPSSGDRVVILNGRVVTISENTKEAYSLQLNEGGELDIGTTTGHNFNVVVGQGKIKLASTTFPAGSFDSFVAAGGGTVEYNNAGNFTFPITTYNNLIVNLAQPDYIATATISDSMQINGNLTIKKGVFQINTPGQKKNIRVIENVTVEDDGKIEVGNNNAVHDFYISGDFINNGIVKFSKLNSPGYSSANTNHIDVYFDNGSKDQYVQCNNTTQFYRIVVDKGTDQTYILNIDASHEDYFKLFGRNNVAATDGEKPIVSGTPPPGGNIRNNKALDIWAGTLRLGNNIVIPSLRESSGTSAQEYYIDSDAMLWLDGAEVTYSVESAAAVTAIYIYGGYKQTGNSWMNNNAKQGFIIRDAGQFFIEDGLLEAIIIRTSIQGTVHRGSFTMSGGVVNLFGVGMPSNIPRLGVYGTFTLPYTTNAINISGGTINILAPNPIGTPNGTPKRYLSVLIGADPNNINITGGTVNLYVPGSSNSHIASTMPFWDLNIISSSNSRSAQPSGYPGDDITEIPVMSAQPLVVLNNLILENRAVLNSGTDTVDVLVGKDFIINSGTTYAPLTNNTIFNGSKVQTFSNSGTITNGLYKMSIINGSELNLAGTASIFSVRNDFEIATESSLRDNTKVVHVAGNIINSGTHIRPSGSAGGIVLNGSGDQDISGDGNGKFNNLLVNKSAGKLTVSSDIQINGGFSLISNIRVDLGSNRLILGEEGAVFSALGTGDVFNNNKMIFTNGLGSDGGITKLFSGSGSETILLPYGFYISDNSTYYYMPSTIEYSDTVEGTITSRPVKERHPLAQDINALGAYWKNTITGFEGVGSNAFKLKFKYNDYFVEGIESDYVAGVYRHGDSWIYLNDPTAINFPTNTITFANQPTAIGDHTAGYASAFDSIPVLYSRQNGDWDDLNTWSETGHDGLAASHTPTQTTLVIIGEGDTIQVNSNGKRTGGLRILAGATLDIGNTTGHDFSAIPEEVVNGSGTLKISSSNYFPAGDFGDFIGPYGGTVEYYTNGANIVIPIESDDAAKLKLNHYRNLVLRIGTDHKIQLPQISKLTIFENLLCTGNKNSVGAIEMLGSSAMELEVKGNFTIDNPTFAVNNTQKDIYIYGDLKLTSSYARFTVSNTSANNRLYIYGDIINDGTLELHSGTGGIIEIIFKGTRNTVIDGTGEYFVYRAIVDKGTNRDPVVTLLSPVSVTLSVPPLELRNGTFRLNRDGANMVVSPRNEDFIIPHTAALSVLNGTARVASITGSGSGKLSLAGRLEVLGGRVFIGDESVNTNNSIEYVSAGYPEIIVEGGELHINGQIRRLTTVTTGNLHYRQSGGTTTIYGKVREPSRGLFEIDNLGSFEMSGGTLQFDCPSAQGGPTFGDVVLRPDSLSVTGGEIKFGLPTSTANYDFKMITSSPVWDLTVGDEFIPQRLTTNVFGITVKDKLLINLASQFKANGLDVTLEGNLVNKNTSASTNITQGGYQPGTSTQTTIFSGNTQTITGTENNLTNFANLLIKPTSSVSLLANTTVRVNNVLEIRSGTFKDGGNFVNVAGDIINSSVHLSSYPAGGIKLVGVKNQKLRGYGATYGNIVIDNTNGISLVGNATINGRLIFENGLLYIDDYLLTLGVNATVEGAFDNHKMIILNGALSDLGVRKMFPSGASSQFTIPIGVDGKYTPATYTITSSTTPGAITVRPVNREHPALNDIVANELQYYWNVDATGFGADLQLTHKYQYVEEDTTGDVDQYVVGLYHYETYTWDNLGRVGNPGKVNKVDNTFEVIDVSYATGDFTAGYSGNFVPLPIYYSRNSGSWTVPSNWSTVGHDDNTSIATIPPRGNPIIIAVGHTMEINADQQMQASVEINGVLDFGKTVFHNLGNVYGTGKIILESTDCGCYVFPAGDYEQFLNTYGTEVELTGSNNSIMPVKPGNYSKPFNNLILSGPGRKNMSADDLGVKGRLEIKNGTTLSNSNHNRNIYISGNWINENTASNSFIAGTGTVFIAGTEAQNINVTVQEKFYNLTMQNNAGLTITNKPVEVMRTLRLTQGVIHSATNSEVILSNISATQAAVGTKNTSFVDGPVKKRIISGQSFSFPTGNDGRLGVVRLTNATSSQQYWTAQYFNSDPNPTYPTGIANLEIPLTAVSDNEYWRVIGPDANSKANISLRYDGVSFPEYTNSSSGRNLLRVVENEADMWTPIGDRVSGTFISGSVYTSVPQTVTQGGHIYSIGAIGVTAIIDDTASWSICDNFMDYAMVPVKLTGNPPYKLTYRTVGEHTREYTESNIMTSQFTIILNGFKVGGYSATPYVLKLVSVSGDGGSTAGFVRPDSVKITVKLNHIPNISGAAIVATGEERTYTTPDHGGSTYLWEWIGASGGTITPTANEAKIEFNSTTGVRVLRVTETSSSGCFAYDEININVQNMPAPSINPEETNICQGTTQIYSTNYNPSNEYRWSVGGGSCIGCEPNFSSITTITVTWNNPTNAGYVIVEEQIQSTTTKSEDTLQVLVSKQPIQRTLLGDEVCQNFAGQITVKNSESGVNYQLVNYNGGSYVGPYLSGNGGDLKLNTLPLQETGNFYVRAYNLGCELRMPADPGTVDVVVQKPDVQLAIDDTDHIICQGTSVNFTASDVATLADSFNFIVNESSVQSSASTSYTTTSLQHNDEIYVVGTTNKGCRDTSSVITVSVGKNIWSGATSNVWGNAGNWACTDLPSLTVNAFIPARATRMPIVGTHSSVKTIEVEAGASLTHSGGIFSIAGDIINRGTFSSSSTATIKLTGENKQKLIDNTGFNFGNLTVDKQGDSVILETKVDISGALTLTSGIVKTDDTNILTLENTASATPGNANSYVVGPMQKIGNTDFTFPIGAGDRRAMIGISDFVGAKSNTTMKAQYYDRKYSEPDNVDGTLHHVSEVEHWLLQNTTANGAKWNVTLYTDDVSLSNINTLYLTDLRVAYFDGVHWTDKGNGGTSFGANSGSIKSGDNFSPNGYFTFGSKNGDNPLPVELINFKAYLHNGQTLLTWLTTTEYNNSHFEVERSDNMIDFIKIGTVYSKAQNGSSTQAIDYAYTDDTPIAGTNYYRLKQVDFNGLYSYSKVVSVTSDRENGPLESIIVYPNPTTGLVNIIVPGGDENIHISLYNYNGALLLEYRHDPSNTIIDLSQYASGLYMLKISNGEKHIVQRVIKQ